jgi:2-polyprenyl-6-hydroxyphenyl methylase/3-demethylubiquinone-9 3-methyltransferase
MGYYAERLAGERLRACYQAAPPRVAQYLEAEIEHALACTRPAQLVLELGCGYGRILERIAPRVRGVVGIDTARESLRLARSLLRALPGLRLAAMDAARLGLRDRAFDLTLCLQNGISAFAVDPLALAREAVRVTRPGGAVLLSSYAARFWPERLAWFEAQAARGLIGEIDRAATGDGVIVCKDGFRATTVGPDGFARLAQQLGLAARIDEVDGSSLFCRLEVPGLEPGGDRES